MWEMKGVEFVNRCEFKGRGVRMFVSGGQFWLNMKVWISLRVLENSESECGGRVVLVMGLTSTACRFKRVNCFEDTRGCWLWNCERTFANCLKWSKNAVSRSQTASVLETLQYWEITFRASPTPQVWSEKDLKNRLNSSQFQKPVHRSKTTAFLAIFFWIKTRPVLVRGWPGKN